MLTRIASLQSFTDIQLKWHFAASGFKNFIMNFYNRTWTFIQFLLLGSAKRDPFFLLIFSGLSNEYTLFSTALCAYTSEQNTAQHYKKGRRTKSFSFLYVCKHSWYQRENSFHASCNKSKNVHSVIGRSNDNLPPSLSLFNSHASDNTGKEKSKTMA